MQAPHHRKIELQSPADLSYLYSNTLALSKEKLSQHFPPSQNSQNGDTDPLESRVRELVEDFILRTFKSATPSISINGLDVTTDSDNENPTHIDPGTTTFSFKTQSNFEYEPYNSNLASKVTALHAKLENLTTDVAKLRREAPKRAAATYAEKLADILKREEAQAQAQAQTQEERSTEPSDESMKDAATPLQEIPRIHIPASSNRDGTTARPEPTWAFPESHRRRSARLRQKRDAVRPEWKLEIPFANAAQQERWRSGDVADVYSNALRTLMQLQGDDRMMESGNVNGDGDVSDSEKKRVRRALATTVGKLERSRKAVDVVEGIAKRKR
ncbi:hypothetical protein KEM56_002258 [Ascosphaera pollenicola]|nr:hypothetical protein KEM56_002258 [Ascosphaera pollenicola]